MSGKDENKSEIKWFSILVNKKRHMEWHFYQMIFLFLYIIVDYFLFTIHQLNNIEIIFIIIIICLLLLSACIPFHEHHQINRYKIRKHFIFSPTFSFAYFFQNSPICSMPLTPTVYGFALLLFIVYY